MQNVTAKIATTNGRKTFNFTVDESIGLNAGRDLYATARGTAMKLARKVNPFPWVNIILVVDDYKVFLSIEDKKWVKKLL